MFWRYLNESVADVRLVLCLVGVIVVCMDREVGWAFVEEVGGVLDVRLARG